MKQLLDFLYLRIHKPPPKPPFTAHLAQQPSKHVVFGYSEVI